VGQGLLIHEVSRSNTMTHHSRLARRKHLYLTTHNIHNRQTSMPRRDLKAQSQQTSGRRSTP